MWQQTAQGLQPLSCPQQHHQSRLGAGFTCQACAGRGECAVILSAYGAADIYAVHVASSGLHPMGNANLQALGSWHGVLAVMFQHPGVLLAALDCSACSCAMLISSSWRRHVSMWGVLKVPAGGICRICRR